MASLLGACYRLLINCVQHRRLLIALTRQKLSERYLGTLGGLLWSLFKPLLTVAVFWFVFSVGFRAEIQAGYPFIVYFLPGYAAWLYFSEVISSSAYAITGNAHLVRKIVFPVEVLPAATLLASAVPHLFILAASFIVVWLHGYRPGLSAFAVAYAFLAMTILSFGFAWLISALQVFFRDVAHVVESLLQIWFWITPIVWPPSILPEAFHWIFYLNPINHIVLLYRAGVTGGVVPWDAGLILAYWLITLFFVFLGAYVFRRLKPEFADVV